MHSFSHAVSTLSKAKSNDYIAYAVGLLRRSNADALYPSYFYHKEARAAYLVINALNVEIASIEDVISNPLAGRLRYQWWRETLKNAISSNPGPHPLAQLLASVPQVSHLSAYHFTRLVNAREIHFLNPTFKTLQQLADYSAGTQASLLYLLLQLTAAPPVNTLSSTAKNKAKEQDDLPHAQLFQHVGKEHEEGHELIGTGQSKGPEGAKNYTVVAGAQLSITGAPDSLTLDHAASHLAVAMTIAILLRSIPHHIAKKINIIPAEIASRHGLQDEALFRSGPSAPGLYESVAALTAIAEAEIATARACFKGTSGVPERAMPAFLSATSAKSFLRMLAGDKVAFDVFNVDLQKRHWKFPFEVWSDYRNRSF